MNLVRFLAPAILLILVTSPGLGQAPNFLVIIADDVTYNDLPLYGGQNIKTPNIDRLASEGVTFNRAYLSMSMCNPCRTELYTGLYPYRSGSAKPRFADRRSASATWLAMSHDAKPAFSDWG